MTYSIKSGLGAAEEEIMEHDLDVELQDYDFTGEEPSTQNRHSFTVAEAPRKQEGGTRIASCNMARMASKTISIGILCSIFKKMVVDLHLDILCLQELNLVQGDKRISLIKLALEKLGLLMTVQGCKFIRGQMTDVEAG